MHEGFDPKALSRLIELYIEKEVEIRGCEKSQKLSSAIKKATEDDWYEEYLAPIFQ